MFRYSLVLLAGLCAAGPTFAATWADTLFEELSKDFGSVPRGPTLTHPFRLKNNTGSPVTISDVRVSCGCVSASALQSVLQPGQETAILARMDTSRVVGVKNVTIYVQFSQPQFEEVRLWVQANSRDDVSVTPDTLSLGQVKRGSSPTAAVNVTFLGSGDSQILGAHSDSNYVLPSVKEEFRSSGEVRYQLSAKLRPDVPVGKWYTDVWLKTNNADMPRVRVPLTVEIESPLSISQVVVSLGQIKKGGEAERKVIIRGVKPFRITKVLGGDDQLQVNETSTDSKQVHVLGVKFKAAREGDMERTIRILTDLKEQNEIDFRTLGQVIP